MNIYQMDKNFLQAVFYADARNDGSGAAYGMYIAAGLAAKPSGGDWASASDSRVKTIGDNYTTWLTELVQLQPKYYKYNGKADGAPDDGVDYVGLIAQEAETVIPSLVSQGKSEIDGVEVDEVGEIAEGCKFHGEQEDQCDLSILS